MIYPYPVTQKEWGTSQKVFELNGVEMHRIVVKPGGFCSIHLHKRMNNLFVVEYGQLSVMIGKIIDDKFVLDEQRILNDGDQVDIPAGIWHQFEAIRDTVALEVYWVDTGGVDIVRYTTGGIRV